MSRIGSGNLFGSLYDPDKRRINAVFNQNPTGQAGQATSFAAAQQSQKDQQARQLAEAQAAAQQQQQQIAAEATAAQQRQQDARQTAMQEQDFKLRQAQFENQRAIEQQQLEESKRASYAQEAARQNQQQASRQVARGANPLNELQFGSLTSNANNNAPMGSKPGNILMAGRQPGQMLHQQLGLSSARAGSAYNQANAGRLSRRQ